MTCPHKKLQAIYAVNVLNTSYLFVHVIALVPFGMFQC